ncbi:MarR family winged helix-turn-helix transcriptional regulator [Pyxidicoccus xibeiensis]|uniref:MarR family winged helix-turn-helix transcriptional regulator n=1 Tax=Pyxidicoccus xibeiensis TaxID=2906759 RepID=UPI0020A6F836|nr:MarR family transcriptional regulator [Pyxidicoccus xibeiensis]MCP3135806.1 MarR family transcriptional regulator [Pyxidicoccus xibeiensis]
MGTALRIPMASPDTPLTRYERLKRLAQRFPELDTSAIETVVTLMKMSNDLSGAFDAHVARHGLSMGRFIVLVRLYSSEETGDMALTPADLAESSGVSRATMTGLLDTLEKDGLISREDHPEDRRMYTVHLTPKARRLLEGMLPDHYRRIGALMANLSEDERTTLRTLMAKVASGIPALRDP